MQFTNPTNNHTETVYGPISWLWVLLFGPIYWAVKGIWTHAVVHLALALLTFGIVHLIYPFLTYRIIRKHYLKIGWVKTESENNEAKD